MPVLHIGTPRITRTRRKNPVVPPSSRRIIRLPFSHIGTHGPSLPFTLDCRYSIITSSRSQCRLAAWVSFVSRQSGMADGGVHLPPLAPAALGGARRYPFYGRIYCNPHFFRCLVKRVIVRLMAYHAKYLSEMFTTCVDCQNVHERVGNAYRKANDQVINAGCAILSRDRRLGDLGRTHAACRLLDTR